MILGVDPGLANVGWALLNHGALQYGHIETEKSDQPGDAARRLAAVLYGLSTGLRLLDAGTPEFRRVVVEWPGGASGFQREGAKHANARAAVQTSTTAGAVYGAAYWLLRGRTEHILTPAPVSWRIALGKSWGIQPKEEAIHAGILERFPQLTSLKKKAQPHILDAVGLALYGHLKTTEKKR